MGPDFSRTASLRTKVSVAGKRNFQGGDKEAETALEIQGRRRRDKISLGNPADSGLIAGFREISVRTRMRGGRPSLSEPVSSPNSPFGHAPARQADVGEIESVDRTRRTGRREAELSPQTRIQAEENQPRKIFERRTISSGRTLRVCQDLIDEFRDSSGV
jgi:hypothetical protein